MHCVCLGWARYINGGKCGEDEEGEVEKPPYNHGERPRRRRQERTAGSSALGQVNLINRNIKCDGRKTQCDGDIIEPLCLRVTNEVE